MLSVFPFLILEKIIKRRKLTILDGKVHGLIIKSMVQFVFEKK